MGVGDYVSHEDALRQVSLTAFSSPTVQSIGFAIRKVGWDTRLFCLESRAMGVGNYVCVEDALRQISLEPPSLCLSPSTSVGV